MSINFLLIFFSILAISSCQYEITKRAFVVISGNFGENIISGNVMFQQLNSDLLEITVSIQGIPPNLGPFLGFHVHTNGILSSSQNAAERCKSAGTHFNPLNSTHGDISSPIRHMGDYGNLFVNQDGTISQTFTDRISSLLGPFSILGRTVLLHEKQDDLGLDPNNENSKVNGNSGSPIACGVIGVWS